MKPVIRWHSESRGIGCWACGIRGKLAIGGYTPKQAYDNWAMYAASPWARRAGVV